MATCRDCPQEVTWAVTSSGKKNPMQLDPAGQFVLEWRPGERDPQAIHVGKPDPLFPSKENRYTSHFSTCPNAAKFRKERK